MNIETFANMKRNAILINVGRGSIVNERDLCCALREGLIAGAALDVLSSEPIRSDSPLLKMADDDPCTSRRTSPGHRRKPARA